DLLATDRGISRHEVVVLGDSLNDAEMIQWAGLGVAMANADPEVQALADEVAPANTDDGVAWVIERLLGL
ncbi:MAG: HAD hydrolase family protein, partial [Brooklawnia sp.]|nr:HAD hydrolase family protein [Brooklawnia sp.]